MNIKDLEGQNPKDIVRSLEEIQQHQQQPAQEEMIQPQANGVTMETPSLDEYDIISSDLSSSSKVNGHSNDVTIEIKTPEFDVLKEQPRYVISKGKNYLVGVNKEVVFFVLEHV